MLKALALAGVVAGSGVIGRLGVSAVQEHIGRLRALMRDGERLKGMLTEQGMTLSGGLKVIARGSVFGPGYKELTKELEESPADFHNENFGEKLRSMEGFSELKKGERELFGIYLQKLAECISSGEIAGAAECFREDMCRIIEEIESGELKRAKVLQTVWLLAGMCAAIILI